MGVRLFGPGQRRLRLVKLAHGLGGRRRAAEPVLDPPLAPAAAPAVPTKKIA